MLNITVLLLSWRWHPWRVFSKQKKRERICRKGVLKVLLELVPSEVYLSGNYMIHITAVKDMDVL